MFVCRDVSAANQVATGLVGDYTGASKTDTLDGDPAAFTMAVTDRVVILAVPGISRA
jgi:hypothetical protein